MQRFLNFRNRDISEIIFLIGGMIIAASIKNTIAASDKFLILVIAILIIIAVFYFRRIYTLIDDRVKLTVSFLFERYYKTGSSAESVGNK